MTTEFQFSPGLGYTLEGRCLWRKWVPAFRREDEEGDATLNPSECIRTLGE